MSQDRGFEVIETKLDPDLSVFWSKRIVQPSLPTVLVVSGTHGIEAFFSSALQREILRHELEPHRNDFNFIFIHGLNPFGIKNFRRVNELNVDLNRNFLIDPADYEQKNEAYALLSGLLVAKQKPSLGFFERSIFLFKTLSSILRFGMEPLRNAVLSGQYEYPQGVFFGGFGPQPQVDFIKNILDLVPVESSSLFVVDIHTGYGQRGVLHRMISNTSSQEFERYKEFLAPHDPIHSGTKKFYQTKGDLLPFIESRFKERNPRGVFFGITWEFGTMDSQKMWGSLESLRIMTQENRSWFYQKELSEVEKQKISSEFKEMFFPSDEGWRSQCMDQGIQEWHRSLSKLKRSRSR